VNRPAIAEPVTGTGQRHVRPVARVSTEFYLRAFDSLTQLQQDIADGGIFIALVHGQLIAPHRKAIGVRELSRRIGMPYETVRRHAQVLVRSGKCASSGGGLSVPASVLKSRAITTLMRSTYVNAVRLLVDLTRIGVIAFPSASRQPPSSGRLTKEQIAISIAGLGLLLKGMRLMRDFWRGDLMKGLVYTAIWTANVKHVANTSLAASATVLADSERQPVSVGAVSRSLRLPYETVRRHADALVREGICVRSGRQGLVVLATTHHRTEAGAIAGYHLVLEFVGELRRSGVTV
jgi:DNA-binding transcriptional ArsR family regulator